MDPRDEHIRILARIAGIPVEEAIRKIGRDHYEENPFDFEKGIMDSIKGVFGMGKKPAAPAAASSAPAAASSAPAAASSAPAAASSAPAAASSAPAGAAPMVLSRPAPMTSANRGGSVTPIQPAGNAGPKAPSQMNSAEFDDALGTPHPAFRGAEAPPVGGAATQAQRFEEAGQSRGAEAPPVGGQTPLQSQSQKASELVAKLQEQRAAKDAPYIKRIQEQQAAKQAANRAGVARVQQESAARKQALLDSSPLARQFEANKEARWNSIMRGASTQPPLGS